MLPGGVLRRLIDRAPVGMSIHDAEGRCLLMNQALADINGISIADAMGRTVHEFVPTLADQIQPHLDEVLATGVERRAEIRGETAAAPGELRWWHATFRTLELDTMSRAVVTIVEDVTDNMRQLESLAASEHQLRRVFEHIDQGFCVCEIVTDDDGIPSDYRFIEVNTLFEEMTGLADAAGHTAIELIPDLEPHWIEAYGRVALDGETMRFQEGSDAMGRWFDVFATPLATPGRFAIVFRDETARHLAEAAESIIAERYRAMADELPLMVWIHGPDGEQEFVNLTYCEFFGVDREQMVADKWQVLVHADDIERYSAAFERAVRDRSEFHEQVRALDATGRWRWVDSWATPRVDPSGVFLGHVGASADVTERVEAERALAASTAFLRNVLDSLFTFVGVLEPDGTVVQANRAPLEAAGIELADVVGKKFWDCFWWSYDERIAEQLRRAVERSARGEAVRYDVPVRIGQPERLWIDFQLVPLRGPDGSITHIIPSGLDITDRRAAERQRAQRLREERERRHRAEILEEHAAGLASAISPTDIGALTVAHIEQRLGLRVAALNLRRGDGLELIASDTIPTSRRPDHVTLGDDMPGPVAIATNHRLVFDDRDDAARRFPGLADALAYYDVASLAALPVRGTDRSAIGAIVVGSPNVGAFRGEHLELLEGLAAQSGLALERALLHEQLVFVQKREHEIAVRLQKALLPDRLVEHPRLAIAAQYQAAGERLEVGGDWYDTFDWASGEVGVMVGDVAGHDLDAAAAMGRLRAAVAALAPTLEPDPSAILRALHDVARGRDGTSFITAACAVIDPSTGSLRVASAGHPPPLLVRRAGAVWLRCEPTPPLGLLDLEIPPARRIELQPDDCVILYSDGLIERRDEPLDVGLERLRAACGRSSDDDLDVYLRRLVDELTSSDTDDDNVVLALRWQPDV